MTEGYRSRKFIITGIGMTMGFVLALFSKVDANIALILAAGIGAYNWANVKQANGKQNA